METGVSAGIVSTEIVRQDGVRRHIEYPTVIVENGKATGAVDHPR